jgi:tRNA threonylcarbamoyladenosine biosynthesis protein TsaB
MIVLAIESATELAGVALADDAGVLAQASSSRGRRHAESIAPAVEFVCRRAGVQLSDVDAIAVDVGPGLFTGLRVGVATAKALAFALEAPVATATSLEVLAHAVAGAGGSGRLVVPVVDARRGEVFVGRFRVRPDGAHPVGEAVRQTPEDLVGALRAAQEPVVVVGDGARRYGHLLSELTGVTVAGPWFDHPLVAVLATMGVARAGAGEVADATSVLPAYLRDADTRIKWEHRARRPPVGARHA